MADLVKNTMERIKNLISERKAALDGIEGDILKTQGEINEQERRIQNAISSGDTEKYMEALTGKKDAMILLDMFRAKYNQIKRMEDDKVTDEESEKIINEILCDEDCIEANYEKEIKGLFEDMLDLTLDYLREVQEHEKAIHLWNTHIKNTYQRQGVYVGCDNALKALAFLDDIYGHNAILKKIPKDANYGRTLYDINYRPWA